MIYVLLAKLVDPIAALLALAVGRLGRSWLVVSVLVVTSALGMEWLLQGGSLEAFDIGTRLIAVAAWAVVGSVWRRAARKGKASEPSGGARLNPIRQLVLGRHLTRLTNWAEAIELTKHTQPIGAGGGVSSLPSSQQVRAYTEMKASRAAISKYPPHLVAIALLRNQKLSIDTGRMARASAIQGLWNSLIEDGLASDERHLEDLAAGLKE